MSRLSSKLEYIETIEIMKCVFKPNFPSSDFNAHLFKNIYMCTVCVCACRVRPHMRL